MSRSTRSVRSQAAVKANRTRRIQREFVEHFGVRTLTAMRVIAGVESNRGRFTDGSLAAYRANLTRGAYSPFVTGGNGGMVGGSLRIR